MIKTIFDIIFSVALALFFARGFGYIFDGVYLTEEQINSQAHLSTDVPGDPIIVDTNGDGEITSSDRVVIGNNQPDFIFGLNNSFKY